MIRVVDLTENDVADTSQTALPSPLRNQCR